MELCNKVILDSIQREIDGKDYFCDGSDRILLESLFEEINQMAGCDVHYLAELDAFTIPGAGEIISKYIHEFSSESVRGYLLHHLVFDNVTDCDKLICSLYMKFRLSDWYISAPGIPSPAHICTRYDAAIVKLKPKRLKNSLLQLMYHPRDFYYLPFSMKMIASWKDSHVRDVLIKYSSIDNITKQDLNLPDDENLYYPSFSHIKREIRFTAIDSLKYYPSTEVENCLVKHMIDDDADVRALAKKTLQKIRKKN